MNTPHVLDELSAYIDGQCSDPDRIARHLQACPACARRHLELLKITAHVQALQAPPVKPDFATRVWAGIAEEPAANIYPWRTALRLACAASFLVLASAGLWHWTTNGEPASPGAVASPQPRLNLSWQDDEQIVEEFSRLLDAGADLDLFGDPEDSAGSLAMGTAALEPALTVLVGPPAAGADDEPLDDGLGELLDALGDTDPPLLEQVLEAYRNEV